MDIVLVGAGNVATHMGPRLVNCGHRVTAVYSRTIGAASALAVRVGAHATDSVENLPASADVCISMLTDSALPEMAGRIVSHFNGNTVFLHTAGSIPMDIWSSSGAEKCGVLYPMVSFSKTGQVDWNQVPLFVEASDPQTLQMVKQLANQISGDVTELDSEGRKSLHLAAVFANNFSNRMYAISQMLLREHGVPFRVMLPLIQAAVGKLELMDPDKAQTGPAARGDRKVVSEHMEMLEGHKPWQELYRLISIDINNSLK